MQLSLLLLSHQEFHIRQILQCYHVKLGYFLVQQFQYDALQLLKYHQHGQEAKNNHQSLLLHNHQDSNYSQILTSKHPCIFYHLSIMSIAFQAMVFLSPSIPLYQLVIHYLLHQLQRHLNLVLVLLQNQVLMGLFLALGVEKVSYHLFQFATMYQ